MKKIILLLMIGLSFSAISLFAQNRQGMQEQFQSYLKDSVQLSQPMTDSVMAIRMQYQPQMRAIFMDQSSGMDDKQAKIKIMRSEMETRYKSAGLTDGQIQEIHDYEDRMMAAMRNRMNGGGGN